MNPFRISAAILIAATVAAAPAAFAEPMPPAPAGEHGGDRGPTPDRARANAAARAATVPAMA